MIFFHAITGVISVVTGLVIVLSSKGTAVHKVTGRVYVASMYVLCFASFGIRDTTPFFKGFGMFHVMAIVSIATVTAGLVPALYRSRFKDWFSAHYASMLWSYVGLIMALNSHFFREVFLFLSVRMELGKLIGLILSMALLWGVPPLLGTVLINRKAPLYYQKMKGRA
ncbi:MAG TPA: DUF2306 domain-containing protein [Blastocatellia bacterium]|nr:DUF2306 domain-containing protein [Blastocatellia bacterium]